MKLFRNKKFNFIVSIVFGLIISVTTSVFATIQPLVQYGSTGSYVAVAGDMANFLAGSTISSYSSYNNLNNLFDWSNTVTNQVNANTGNISTNTSNISTLQGYFNTLFGATTAPNQTMQDYIDSEIANALTTPPTGPSSTTTYTAVQGTINYWINQAFNSSSAEYATFQTAVNSLISTATNNFASISSVASNLSPSSTTMPSAVDNYIQTELGSGASNPTTIQNAVNSFLTSTTGLTITSGKTPALGSLKQYINHVILNALKTKIPKGGSPNALQSAVNSLVGTVVGTAITNALAPVSKSLPNGGAVTKAISAAVTPLQDNFATLFGTDKKGNINTPTQTLGNYIRAGTTITIAHALNTQNPKSNSPAQQLQSAVTSVVAPTITQAINTAISPLQTGVKTLNTKFSTWFRANDALTQKFQSAMNKYLANALSAPNPAAASSEHTLQFTVDSRINNIIFSGLQTGGTIHSAINTNSLSHITNSLNTPIPTGGSPNALQAAVNSLASTAAGTAITTALAPATKTAAGGSITQAISTAVSQLPKDINTSGTAINKAMNQFIQFYLSPTNSTFQSAVNSLISSNQTVSTLNTNFTTIFGSSTPTGNLQSYLNNGVAFALSNDSKGAPNSGNAQSAVNSVVTSALGGSGTDIQSAVSAVVASHLESGSTSITQAMNDYINTNFLTPPSSGATPSASWTALQSAVQTASQGANGVWYFNNPNNINDPTTGLQAILNNAATVATSSNPQTVRLAAGQYKLTTTLTIPSYVTLEGVGKFVTQLIVNFPVVMEPSSVLSSLTVRVTTSFEIAAIQLNPSTSTNSTAQNRFTLSQVYINNDLSPNDAGPVVTFTALPNSLIEFVVESSTFRVNTLAQLGSGQNLSGSSFLLLNNSFQSVGNSAGGCGAISKNNEYKGAGFSSIIIGNNTGDQGSNNWIICSDSNASS